MLTSSSHEEVIDAKTRWHTLPPSAFRDQCLLCLLIYIEVRVDKEIHFCVSCCAFEYVSFMKHTCPQQHFHCQSKLIAALRLIEALRLLQVMIGFFMYKN